MTQQAKNFQQKYMQNDTLALNNYLVAALELIEDEKLALPEIGMEITRAKALLQIAEYIMDIQCFREKINRLADPELTKAGLLMERIKLLITDLETGLKTIELQKIGGAL
jgi:hypothetical protein